MDILKIILTFLVITVAAAISYDYYYQTGNGVGPEGSGHKTNCNAECISRNYQYGVCREENYGCVSDELDLGKDSYGCMNKNCCCVTGCDFACKDKGYDSGECRISSECEDGELNIGSGICRTGWPTTAYTLCCCK